MLNQIAAVSAAADGLYLKRMLETVLGTTVFLELRMDSSAARAMLKRQGVQKTRHISTGLLWVQDKVASNELLVKPIAGQHNPADLGTKAHSQKRLKNLLGTLGYQEELGGEQLQEPQQELSVRRLGRLLPLMLAALSPGKVDGGKSLEESKVCQETSYFYVAGTWFWMFVNVVVAIVWSFMVSAMVTFIGCWLVFYVRDHIEEEQRREHEEQQGEEEAEKVLAEGYMRFEIRMVREARGEESQDDSWSFLLWMGMRVILRIQRIERPAGAVRWLRNVQRLEVLRGVFQDLENRRVPREEIDRFVMHMADLSEDEDEDLTNVERVLPPEEVLHELRQSGVFDGDTVPAMVYEEDGVRRRLPEEVQEYEEEIAEAENSDAEVAGIRDEPEPEEQPLEDGPELILPLEIPEDWGERVRGMRTLYNEELANPGEVYLLQTGAVSKCKYRPRGGLDNVREDTMILDLLGLRNEWHFDPRLGWQ